jgi:uncharacterized Tic20 family protein
VRPVADRPPDSLTAVQLNWIVMQVVLVVLVLAGMIIAATKLWL